MQWHKQPVTCCQCCRSCCCYTWADGEGKSPLHCAAETGAVEAAGYLLSLGAAVNGRDKRGLTALHHAALAWHCGRPGR